MWNEAGRHNGQFRGTSGRTACHPCRILRCCSASLEGTDLQWAVDSGYDPNTLLSRRSRGASSFCQKRRNPSSGPTLVSTRWSYPAATYFRTASTCRGLGSASDLLREVLLPTRRPAASKFAGTDSSAITSQPQRCELGALVRDPHRLDLVAGPAEPGLHADSHYRPRGRADRPRKASTTIHRFRSTVNSRSAVAVSRAASVTRTRNA